MSDKNDKKVWFITGAGRGMGADFARAALAAGHEVVASGRDKDRIAKVLGQPNELLTVTLDVTSLTDAHAAVRAAVDRFGRIDVLVNNAASFYAGYFEELTPDTDGQTVSDEPNRADERHPSGSARDAPATLRPHHHDLVVSGPHGL